MRPNRSTSKLGMPSPAVYCASAPPLAFLLPETPEQGARAVSSRIREVITSLVFLKKRKLTLQPAVYTMIFEKGTKPEDVIADLDHKLSEMHDHEAI